MIAACVVADSAGGAIMVALYGRPIWMERWRNCGIYRDVVVPLELSRKQDNKARLILLLNVQLNLMHLKGVSPESLPLFGSVC
jgi:hypothetical protein